MTTVCLRRMAQGQKGIIDSVTVSGELGRRMRAMGLIPGAEITVFGRAPLYDPVAVKITGTTLTLRNDEASHIFVTVD